MVKRQQLGGVNTDMQVLEQRLVLDNKFVVDAGCGNMHLAKSMAKQGARVLAIDPDPVQAEKNRNADVIANVGFVEAGADKIPVEPALVDGVVFGYSLHHIPPSLYPAVLQEMQRILKPDGFVYVMEPVAAGDLNAVMQLFHDERKVRADAQRALDELFMPAFAEADVIDYQFEVQHDSFESYASRYGNKSFNTSSYTEADVWRDEVRHAFEAAAEKNNNVFLQQMRVSHMHKPVVPA